ncbi:Vacuolar protein sorting-associated protein 37A [Actinomortierella wolfii]|nr:Vacuolar protein sorting-associated protein 37A [Actinomortierella wolfii]
MVPSVQPASTDDSRYQVTINLGDPSPSSPIASSASGRLPQDLSRTQPVTMTIELPVTFPEVPPRITIFPTVRHLWVDGSVVPAEVNGHERLKPQGWSMYADLGALVKELVDSIQKTGVLVDPSHHHLGRTGSGIGSNSVNSLAGSLGNLKLNNNNNNNSSSSNSFHHPGTQSIKHVSTDTNGSSGINSNKTSSSTRQDTNPPSYDDYSHKPPPPIPARTNSHSLYRGASGTSISSHGNAGYAATQTPEAKIILGLTQDQVTELLESPIAFEHFFDNLEMVVNSKVLKREWWTGNDNVARRTLAMEAELKDLQERTKKGYEEATRLQQQLEEKLQQQQDALWRFKPETMHSKLRSAMAESEELSDSVSQSYMDGRLDPDSFIRQFRELRKVYHMRGMKSERLLSTLKPLSSSGVAGAAAVAGGVGSNGSGGSSVVTSSAGPGRILTSFSGSAGSGGVGGMGSAGLGLGSASSGSLVNGVQPAPNLAEVESGRTGSGSGNGTGGGGSGTGSGGAPNGNGELWVVL